MLLAGLAAGLRLPGHPRLPPLRCCALPWVPPLGDATGFQRGILEPVVGTQLFWRQNNELVQVIVVLPEDASFKRDVSIELTRTHLSLTLSGTELLAGALAFEVDPDRSDWIVEDELDGFTGEPGCRFLVVDLKKKESFVDWGAPVARSSEPEERRLVIGGKGDAQRRATAQQLASYQVLQKLPATVRGDVYARAPPGAEGEGSQGEGEESAAWMRLYFVGKVVAEASEELATGATQDAALAAQVVLVKEHARVYLPDIFGPVADEEMELWLAPGNSEMAVAQDEVALRQWSFPAGVTQPAAGACGFEPETAPPAHMGAPPLSVRRDAEGRPLGKTFKANVMSPDQVPGAYEAWLKNQ